MDIPGRQRTVRRRIDQMQRVDCREAGVESGPAASHAASPLPDGRNTELLVPAPDHGDGEPSPELPSKRLPPEAHGT